MIVLIALFVFGYRLPVTNSRQKHYQQHGHPIKKRTSNTRSPNHVFQLQRLFSSSHWRWYSNLGNHVAFAQKNGTSTHLAWQHCHDFEFQIRDAKPKNCATLGGRSIEYIFSYDEICLHICCAWIQQRSINFVLGLMCCDERAQRKKSQTVSHHCEQFSSWLAWGGSNLAQLAVGFSLESCFLPYQTNRSTTRTKVYLSQVAFAQMMQSMAWQTVSLQGTLERRPFQAEMVSKEWLPYQTKRKLFKNVLHASKIWGSRIRGSD